MGRGEAATLGSRAPRGGPVHAKHAKSAEGVAQAPPFPEKRDMPQSVHGVCPRKRERSPGRKSGNGPAGDPEAISDPLAGPFGERRTRRGHGLRPAALRAPTTDKPPWLDRPALGLQGRERPARDRTHRAKDCPATLRAPGPTAGCNPQGIAARDLIRGDAWNPGEGLPSHAQDRKVPREPAPGYHPHPVFGRSGDGNVAGAKPPRGRLDGNGGSRTDRLAGRQGKRAATPRAATMGVRPACRRTHATGSTGGSGWTDGGTGIPRDAPLALALR